MAIEDYLPNVFASSAPAYLQGLLGAEETQKLQGRANVQGLLGAGLALAQGMSRTGPRRSAAENILGALAGGFGAAGGAYDQGIKNYVTQQQIAQTQLAQQDALLKRQQAQAKIDQIKAIEKEDPALARLLMINEAEGAKQLALKQQVSGLTGRTGDETPEGLRAQAQGIYATGNAGLKPLADSLIEKANRLEVEGRLRPQAPTAGVQQPAQEVPAEAAPGSLPGVTVVGQQGPDAQLLSRKNQLLTANQSLATVVSKEARDTIKANSDEIASIDKQLDRFAASEYNFDAIEQLVPQQFKGSVRSLKDRAQTGALSLADISRDIANIESKAIEFVTKKTDYTNEARRVAAGMFNGRPIEELQPIELMKLQNAMDQMEIQKRRAGATTINLPSESERTAGFLTNRIVGSLDQLKAVTGAAPSAASPNFKAEIIKYFTGSDYLKNLANPETRQQVEAAQLEILDAALTLGTGAAYTKEQLLNYQKSYFPQLGDKPATVKDKAQRLSSLLDSAMIKSGRAAPKGSAPIFSPADLQNAVDAELERRKGKK
jgi:hypothetical protein